MAAWKRLNITYAMRNSEDKRLKHVQADDSHFKLNSQRGARKNE